MYPNTHLTLLSKTLPSHGVDLIYTAVTIIVHCILERVDLKGFHYKKRNFVTTYSDGC